jgi:hypothetical protein
MTDIAVPQTATYGVAPDQQPVGVDLELWARKATSAAVYADAVCRTSMVPAAYKGKPEEATAAILAGAELGFSPMASLRAFDNIQGTPAPKALTLRAVVQAAGHEVVTVEQTPTRAAVKARRRGDSEWQTSTWDIDRAEAMGLLGKAQWKQQPAAMLVARATAEVCRWIASDAIMGMPYAAEELDGEQHAATSRPTARRLSVADLDQPPVAIEADGPITAEQRADMAKLWGLLGYTDSDEDRTKRLWLTSQILGLGNELESSDELTRVEADQVIVALRSRLAQAGGPDA